jgi:hypothetical protein
MTTFPATSSAAWQAEGMTETDSVSSLPAVHYVKDNGEHQLAYLRKETPHGARLMLPVGSNTDSKGNVQKNYLYMGGVQRDEGQKMIGTWHMPEAA